MVEEWRAIKGYGGAYEVSSEGRVRSLRFNKIKILKQMTNAGRYNGYAVVTLYDENHRGKKLKVHRLVAEAFLPNPERYPSINHKDEEKTNNNVNNLEWCSVRYNNTYGTARQRAAQTLKLKRAVD